MVTLIHMVRMPVMNINTFLAMVSVDRIVLVISCRVLNRSLESEHPQYLSDDN